VKTEVFSLFSAFFREKAKKKPHHKKKDEASKKISFVSRL